MVCCFFTLDTTLKYDVMVTLDRDEVSLKYFYNLLLSDMYLQNRDDSLPYIIITVVSLLSFLAGSFIGVFVGVPLFQKIMKIKRIHSSEDVQTIEIPVYETVKWEKQAEIVDLSSNVAYGKVNL